MQPAKAAVVERESAREKTFFFFLKRRSAGREKAMSPRAKPAR